MSSVIDRIKARVSSEPVSIEVKEWGEVVYARPLTCGEMTDLQRRHPDFPVRLTGEAMVDLVIRKALTKEDKKMFTLEDKAILLRESTTIISTIVSGILSAYSSIEDAEKN